MTRDELAGEPRWNNRRLRREVQAVLAEWELIKPGQLVRKMRKWDDP
jgi:hypothetical protein